MHGERMVVVMMNLLFRRYFYLLVVLLLAACASEPIKDYRIMNNGEETILSGAKYGNCAAGAKLDKLEVTCSKNYRLVLVMLADSFEVIEPEEQ